MTETVYNKKTTEMAWPRSSHDRNSLQQEDDGDGLAALVTRTETVYNKKTTEMVWPRSSHDRNSLQQEDDGDGLAALVT